ncbi:MAG TPA: outer membrane beta-barrel protein [Candidatus Acidoferrum sp.]|jgi:hypothetical protein|nr:outer membrane beta-barrel protein [Candidatus Acidoferrum sp.]
MRKNLITFVALLFFGCYAAAQIPSSGNLFAGYSYYNTDLNGIGRQSINGWEGSLEGKLFPVPFLGVVADFSANYGDLKFPNPALSCPVGTACPPANINSHVDNFFVGPRVGVSVGRVRPFAQALFGFAHINTNGFGSDTSFATGVGGGIDYKLISLLGVRFQGDYIHTQLFNTTQNNVRLSTGLVLRF